MTTGKGQVELAKMRRKKITRGKGGRRKWGQKNEKGVELFFDRWVNNPFFGIGARIAAHMFTDGPMGAADGQVCEGGDGDEAQAEGEGRGDHCEPPAPPRGLQAGDVVWVKIGEELERN